MIATCYLGSISQETLDNLITCMSRDCQNIMLDIRYDKTSFIYHFKIYELFIGILKRNVINEKQKLYFLVSSKVEYIKTFYVPYLKWEQSSKLFININCVVYLDILLNNLIFLNKTQVTPRLKMSS